MKTETPITESATWTIGSGPAEGSKVVNADVCEQLERELAEAELRTHAAELELLAMKEQASRLAGALEALRNGVNAYYNEHRLLPVPLALMGDADEALAAWQAHGKEGA